MFNLGILYDEDRLGVTQSLKKAVEFYTMAAVQGHVKAMYNLALLMKMGKELHNHMRKRSNCLPWLQNRERSKRCVV